MFNFHKIMQASLLVLVATFSQQANAAENVTLFGLGKPVTATELAGWDIDIRPDGMGLPKGSGTVDQGDEVYQERCAHCHGEFGYGGGTRYPELVGGEDTLTTLDPRKTIGSYWPYASTLFDYIRRAMPFGEAQTLTNDEVYALSAFLLNINSIVDDDAVMNSETLAKVIMPNVNGFIEDTRPDVQNVACMKDCVDTVEVFSYAKKVGVTPDQKD